MNGSFELEINENIARITSKIDNEILATWKINKQDIINAINLKENLIKYLEKESKEVYRDGGIRQRIFQDLLERVKNNNYES